MTTDPRFYEVVDATWPAAQMTSCGPFTVREGQGGGSRVSAATLEAEQATAEEIAAAEQAMRDLGQMPKFMIRDGQDGFDAQLENLGYQVLDPVNIWACPAAQLTGVAIPRVTTFAVWEPLQICREIWNEGGIGPERQAIMERADCPKVALLGRHRDKPAGAGYCGVHDGVAMVHALEILPHQRRQGMGAWMMRQAAFWAVEQGAETLSVICTKRNDGANGLYASLGMECVGQYHYRHKPKPE